MLKNRPLAAALLVLVIVIGATSLGFLTSKFSSEQKTSAQTPQIPGLFWPNPKQLGQFSALDQNNQNFELSGFENKWSLIFFGFTHCPDICPITLNLMKQAEAIISERDDLANTQFVFVSTDPKRDTPEAMKTYINYFNSDFIGLTGDPQIESLNRQIGVVSILGEPDEKGDYTVDHSASMFIIDPKGRIVGKLSPPHVLNNTINIYTGIREFIEANDS